MVGQARTPAVALERFEPFRHLGAAARKLLAQGLIVQRPHRAAATVAVIPGQVYRKLFEPAKSLLA